MSKLPETIDRCILLHTSLPLFPNNWLTDSSIELDHPLKTNCLLILQMLLP